MSSEAQEANLSLGNHNVTVVDRVKYEEIYDLGATFGHMAIESNHALVFGNLVGESDSKRHLSRVVEAAIDMGISIFGTIPEPILEQLQKNRKIRQGVDQQALARRHNYPLTERDLIHFWDGIEAEEPMPVAGLEGRWIADTLEYFQGRPLTTTDIAKVVYGPRVAFGPINKLQSRINRNYLKKQPLADKLKRRGLMIVISKDTKRPKAKYYSCVPLDADFFVLDETIEPTDEELRDLAVGLRQVEGAYQRAILIPRQTEAAWVERKKELAALAIRGLQEGEISEDLWAQLDGGQFSETSVDWRPQYDEMQEEVEKKDQQEALERNGAARERALALAENAANLLTSHSFLYLTMENLVTELMNDGDSKIDMANRLKFVLGQGLIADALDRKDLKIFIGKVRPKVDAELQPIFSVKKKISETDSSTPQNPAQLQFEPEKSADIEAPAPAAEASNSLAATAKPKATSPTAKIQKNGSVDLLKIERVIKPEEYINTLGIWAGRKIVKLIVPEDLINYDNVKMEIDNMALLSFLKRLGAISDEQFESKEVGLNGLIAALILDTPMGKQLLTSQGGKKNLQKITEVAFAELQAQVVRVNAAKKSSIA